MCSALFLLIFLLLFTITCGRTPIKLYSNSRYVTIKDKHINAADAKMVKKRSLKKSLKTVKFDRVSRNVNDNITVSFSRSIGSPYFDYDFQVELPSNSSVLDLKRVLYNQYPKYICMMHGEHMELEFDVIHENKILENDVNLNTVRKSSEVLPLRINCLTLNSNDLLTDNDPSPTSNYITMYNALLLYESYLNSKLFGNPQSSINPNSKTGNAIIIDEKDLRQILSAINDTLWQKHSDELSRLFNQEQYPVLDGFRNEGLQLNRYMEWNRTFIESIVHGVHRIVNIVDMDDFKSISYNSLLLYCFAAFGSPSILSSKILYSSIVALWASRVHAIRSIVKVVTYSVLPLLCQMLPISPLLPVAQQVIIDNWGNFMENIRNQVENTREGGDKQNIPGVIPYNIEGTGDMRPDSDELYYTALYVPRNVTREDLEAYMQSSRMDSKAKPAEIAVEQITDAVIGSAQISAIGNKNDYDGTTRGRKAGRKVGN